MANKIDELLKSKKWKKEEVLPKKLVPEEAQNKAEEELERTKLTNAHKWESHGFKPNIEAFKTREASESFRTTSLNYWRLGHTGAKPRFDSWPQGGNAWPRRRRREHPSGHHNCG